ncbi:DUF1934 domain-containing protein [Paenibacillus sp. LHD-117]|uniref:DUF1934 domain-containing protein n=1 Tax=Paenibacillus sp. LHD-117 TaxID=3071412 RepID=UPI0027E139C6|nr:DUF1934 domain-containing protein [Paenibacillus sp. LHD-117]MDQ6420246.1 DUF1934 domain-containing protein [Paenibacillus sp. LHD-117]
MEASGKITLTLESVQDGERQVEIYRGEWFRKAKAVYIRYAEGGADSAAAGTSRQQPSEGEVRTLIRYSPGELSLTRNGAVRMEQLFVAGQRRKGSYRSAMTAFGLETDTTKLSIQGDEGVIDGQGLPAALPFTLEWAYGLLVEEQLSGRFHIRLHIQEEL